jgi:hypothetical protein
MLIPGIGTPIEKAVQEHYKGRVAQIQMYHQGATALGSALAAGPMGPDGKPTGIDPTTGQPMTPERKAQVQAQYEEAWTRYTEAAGVDKKTKDMLKKSKMMTDHLVGGGHNIPYPGAANGGAPGASGAAAPPNGAPPPPPGAPTPGMSLANVEASNAEQQKLRVGGQEAQFAREKSAADIQSDIATKKKIVIDSGGDPNSPLSMRYIYGTMMGGNFAGKVVRLPDGTIAPALQDPKLGGQYLDPQTYQPLVGAIEVPKYAALDKRTGIEYQDTPTGPKLRGWQDPITHKFYAADSTTEIAEPKTWNPALTPTTTTSSHESINPVTGERQTLSSTSTKRPGVPGPPPSPKPTAKPTASTTVPTKSQEDTDREAAYQKRQDRQNITSATRTMIESAPAVMELSSRVRALVNAQKDSLGPAASRWADFMSRKVGAPNPEFTKLITDTDLLSTRLMRMHMGARGGEHMMEHFKNLIDTSKQSPENLLAALDEIDQYAKEVAAEGKPSKAGGGVETPASSGGASSGGKWNPKTGRYE